VPRILAIDDHDFLLRNLGRLLGRLAPTDVARNRGDALQLVTSGRRYDVAVVDLLLDGDHGVELVHALLDAVPGCVGSVVFHSGQTPLPPLPLAVDVPHVLVTKGDLVGLRTAVMARLGGW